MLCLQYLSAFITYPVTAYTILCFSSFVSYFSKEVFPPLIYLLNCYDDHDDYKTNLVITVNEEKICFEGRGGGGGVRYAQDWCMEPSYICT